jgi:phosphoribosyl 1,2-cyclic phosphodiesterase
MLASGSKGNCTYIENHGTSVLIDFGLSYKTLSSVALKAELDISSVSAVINTHCHSDHCAGIADFIKKHDVPVYCHTDGVSSLCKACGIDKGAISAFNGAFSVGSITFTPFLLSHDAPVCCGFLIEGNGKRISIATDLGIADDSLFEYFFGADLSVIESNHDVDMLLKGRYPRSLKQRILSQYGHLSNLACSEAAYKMALRGNRNFVLAHLSEENNIPELAYSSFRDYFKERGIDENNYTLTIASQRKPTKVFCL